MPHYLVIAHDPLLCSEGARARVPAGAECERHHAAALKFDTVFAQLGMPDMFASRRAYIYVDFLDLELKKGEGERFAALLKRLPEETTLICTQAIPASSRADQEKLLKRADYQRVAEGAVVDDLRRLSEEASASRWLIARAKEQHGLVLAPVQARRIYVSSGEQLSLAAAELTKLALLKAGPGLEQVADSALDANLSLNPTAHFYELADAIMSSNPRAVALLQEWFAIEPGTHRLVGELRRRLLGLRALALGEKVFPPFFEKQLRAFIPRWPQPRLRAAIMRLAELEFALKSGGTAGETSEEAELGALELFVSTLLAPAPGSRA